MATPISQLITEIRGDLHEYTSVVWRNTDLVVWINDAMQAVISESHGIMEDWLTRRMRSTDAPEQIQDETYSPTSLLITGGTDLYTLPPNVLTIRSLEPLTATARQSGLTFLPMTMTSPEFLRTARLSSQQQMLIYYYTVVGPRTLRLSPVPATGVNIDTELWYSAYPERISQSGSISDLPIWAMKAIKAYTVWMALQSINSEDVNMKREVYVTMIREFNSMQSPRILNDPKFVEGAFDEEDYNSSTSY